jgi:hypothetical protein
LKTVVRKDLGVRVPRPPLLLPLSWGFSVLHIGDRALTASLAIPLPFLRPCSQEADTAGGWRLVSWPTVDHEDNYENYEPEPGDLVTPYERFIEELDDRLAGLISKCEYDEDFEADYDEDGLAGVYTTLTLVATPEVRATLMESRDALTESARLAGITSLILAVASWDRHDFINGRGHSSCRTWHQARA